MLYLLLIVVLAALVYVAWRTIRTQANRPMKRVIGPDDDPDFLSRLRHDDPNPR